MYARLLFVVVGMSGGPLTGPGPAPARGLDQEPQESWLVQGQHSDGKSVQMQLQKPG